jgi:NADPH-dependent curcumin reductase CurA
LFNLLASLSRRRAAVSGVKYDSMLQKPSKQGLERIGQWAEEGKLKAVVGGVVRFDDLNSIREECERIGSGKGGRMGKVVVEIVQE